MKVIIVGGVAGGASAATRLRRLDESAEILMIERGEYVSFANCGLPYHIGGVITKREKLLIVKPSLFRERFNINVRTQSEVTVIHRDSQEVEIRDLTNNNTYRESYDKLILSPGAAPIRPPVSGIDSSRIFALRTIPDMDAIIEYIEKNTLKKAIVVGGGFIGLEMAENLHHRGMKVTIVELAQQVMTPLDFDMAAIIHQHLQKKQIGLFLDDGVALFRDDDSGITVGLNSGTEIKADMVILAIGVRSEIGLAKEAGLEVNRGIVVNNRMETSDPEIYAVGDAIEVKDFLLDKQIQVPLAWPANKQGRIAADNIAGRDSEYKGTQGTAIAKVFDLTVSTTGLNEKTCIASDIPYQKSFTHSADHAGYYPGAMPMSIKLLFAPDNGKILGAQIIGMKGVDKRIDVCAVALRASMTVYDLEELELSYAPPYSSAKDPVVMAGFVAANILRGDINIFHWHDVAPLIDKQEFFLDVRTQKEFELGNINNALNLPVDDLRDKLDMLPQNRKMYVYCQSGLRSYLACRMLLQKGFDCINLSGGYLTYNRSIQKHTNNDV